MAAESPAKAATAIKPEESDKQAAKQPQPGMEVDMETKPIFIRDSYKGADKLKGKVAIITGGDSGIGRAVAVHFAREGADVAILYLDEHKDADETAALVEKEGRKCLKFAGDVGKPETAKDVVSKVLQELGHVDILVNNASIQVYCDDVTNITNEQLMETFQTNVFGYFYMAQAALPHMKEGASIINTSSVTAFQGNGQLVDYASSKGAQLAFTRSLSNQLLSKGIRVNAVAPGPIWTPLIPSCFPREMIESWKQMATMKRPGQPCEVAPCYVFLASEDSSYISGQTLHPNGGTVVNG